MPSKKNRLSPTFTISIPIDVPLPRGGVRPGAGRKAMYGTPVVTRAYTMRQEDIHRISQHRYDHGCSSDSEALRHLIDKASGVPHQPTTQVNSGLCPGCNKRIEVGRIHRCETGDVYTAEHASD